MIAIKEAWRAGLLGRAHWGANLGAGLVVGVVALPLAMAFAIASGARPEQGLYTAIVAGTLVSLFGGSRVQIAGPTGAFIAILSGITAQHGIAGLQLATLMAGAMLVLLGLARLGGILRFIPAPVIAGFTAGIGIIIFTGQWASFLGLPAPAGLHFHEKMASLLPDLAHWHPATTLLGALSLLLVLVTPRVPGIRRLPGPLVALVAVTLLQTVAGFDGVATIGSAFGGIPRSLPWPTWPEVSLDHLLTLVGPAFTIAMLCAIESLLSAVVADGMAGTRHDANQELIGQGIANLVAPLFAGFAATGAIARTATSVRSGGNGPLAGLVHAAVLVLVIVALAPLASAIPLTTLAAILFVVAWNMSELPHCLTMIRRAPAPDVAVLLITFALTVFADLVVAVNIGVILASLLFLQRMAGSVSVRRESTDEVQALLTGHGLPATDAPPVYAIEGPLFFAAVDQLERLLEALPANETRVLLRLRQVPFMDISGLQALAAAIRQLQARGITVHLSEANGRVRRKLNRSGVSALVGPAALHASVAEALQALTA